jgi:PAS domain S-box-containing protein
MADGSGVSKQKSAPKRALSGEAGSAHGANHAAVPADAFGERYSQSELATLFSLGPTWAWETDSEHRYIYISDGMEAATGISQRDLIGRTRRECFFVNPALSPQILAHLDDLAHHRPFSDVVFEAAGPEGRHSWISISGVPRFRADGTFNGYYGISRTLSDKAFVQSGLQNATERLQRMEALLGEVFESIPVGISLYDREHNFLTCNAHYRRMYDVIADLLVPGTALVPILEAAYDRGMLALPPLEPGDTAEAARKRWFDTRLDQFSRGVYSDVTVLADGTQLKQISKRLDDGTFISVRVDISDAVKREAALEAARRQAEAAEARLTSAINGLSSGFALWDQDSRLVLCNAEFRSMVGIGVKVEIGDTYEQILRRVVAAGQADGTDGDSESWVKHVLALFTRQGGVENVYRHPDGRWILHRVTVTENGERVDVRADVTDIKNSETRLFEARGVAEDARSRLRVAIESLSTGFALWDADDRLVMCNSRLKAMASPLLDFKEGETYRAIMQRIVDAGLVVAAAQSGDPQAWLQSVVAQRARKIDGEYTYLSQAGRWILQRETVTPNGERVDIRTDITDIKNNEARLADALEQAKLAREVINTLDEPVFVKDENLRFVFCNDAFARVQGVESAAIAGTCAIDFVSADQAALFEADERRVLESGEPCERHEDYIEGGEERSRIVRIYRLTTEGGGTYIAATMFDVTAMRQRERALAEASRRAEGADRAKSEFLAQMSHEIRTPMNGVLSMAELLSQSALDHRQQLFVDVIRKSGGALLSTLNNILDFSKIDSGSMTLDPKPFALRPVIDDVAHMLAARACERETELTVAIAPGLPAIVTGDETRLRQILANLVSNAIKFTEGGEVTIAADGVVIDGVLNLEIAISDTGCGIAEDKIGQIFDRFSQVADDDGARREGTGLGLSIVSRLAEMMGGSCVASSTLNEGSVFRLELPLACSDARAPATPVPTSLLGRRVLVIGASDARRDSIVKPLLAWGFDACGADDVPLATALCLAMAERGEPVDLLLLDCTVAGPSCLELARAFDETWMLAPIRKVLLMPASMALPTTPPATLAIAGVLAAPVRQSELYHQVLAALQARATQAGPAVARSADAGVDRARRQGDHVDILVAEDNPVNQLVMAQILDTTGLTYQIVADGALAVAAFREMRPSLILMDINMPNLNGHHATEAIRALTEIGGDTVPIIGVTAHVMEHEREACLLSGMNDHLAKPLSPDTLLGRIAQWLPDKGRKRA